MAATLLTAMLMSSYICEGALLRKSTASGFLQKTREKHASECVPGGCSTEVSEAGELVEVDVGYEDSPSLLYNGGAAQKETNYLSAGQEAVVVDEGSGM